MKMVLSFSTVATRLRLKQKMDQSGLFTRPKALVWNSVLKLRTIVSIFCPLHQTSIVSFSSETEKNNSCVLITVEFLMSAWDQAKSNKQANVSVLLVKQHALCNLVQTFSHFLITQTPTWWSPCRGHPFLKYNGRCIFLKKVNCRINVLLLIFLLTPDPNWKSFSSYSVVGQYTKYILLKSQIKGDVFTVSLT